MSKEILFNYLKLPKTMVDDEGNPKGLYTNTPMQVLTLDKIPNFDANSKNLQCLMMLTTGARTAVDNIKLGDWNNCTFEDIDYKKYLDKTIPPSTVYNNVWNWLIMNCKDIIYYGELSRSGNGFHFIFYFDCECDKENFKDKKIISQYFIKKAFAECGYADIINYAGVYDTCTSSIGQLCFITKNCFRTNVEVTGDYEELVNKNYYELQKYVKPEKIERSHNTVNNEWEISFDINNLTENNIYFDHYQRMNIYKSLCVLYKNDDDGLKNAWLDICKQLPEQNGHKKYFYISEPYKNDWFKKRQSCEYVDKELLEYFGYNISFKSKTIKTNILKNNNENNNKKTVKEKRIKRVYL